MPDQLDVQQVLENLDEEAEEVETSQSGNTDIPEGTFQVEIDQPSNGFRNEDSDGAIRARVIMRVLNASDETVEGATDTKSWYLVDPDGNLNEMGVGILKGDLETMGIEFTKLSEIDELLAQTIGAVVNINRVRNGDYLNTYFNDLVEASDAYEETSY